GHVDDVQHPENQGTAHGEHSIRRAERNAVHYLLEERRHRDRSPRQSVASVNLPSLTISTFGTILGSRFASKLKGPILESRSLVSAMASRNFFESEMPPARLRAAANTYTDG